MVHIDAKQCAYFPTGSRDIPSPMPLYSSSNYISPHHPHRKAEHRWAVPTPHHDDDGYSVFHTIAEKGKESETMAPETGWHELPTPEAPVDYEDPFFDSPPKGP